MFVMVVDFNICLQKIGHIRRLICPILIVILLAELVDHEAGAQLRLEPGGLWGHDVAGVGNVDNLLHADGIEGEGDLHLAAVDATFQLAEAADAAHEVDALVGAQVFDAEYLVEDEVAEDGDVEHSDGIVVVVGAGLGGHLVPVAVMPPRRWWPRIYLPSHDCSSHC